MAKIKSAEQIKKAVDEILEKRDNYESRMSNRLARWTEIAELYLGKTYTGKDNFAVSPNSPELYKAIRAISNMQYRMLTSQRPFFSLDAADILGHSDPTKLLKAEHYVQMVLDKSRYNPNLLRALTQLNLYGTVAVHALYEPMRQTYLGKPLSITTFHPVSLVNCAFSLDATELETASWVCLTDVESKRYLHKVLKQPGAGSLYDLSAVRAAIDDQMQQEPKINTWTQQRLAIAGYIGINYTGGMEKMTYYGPIDAFNDGLDYCFEIINRKFAIRVEEYSGLRPVHMATINAFDVEPLGNGLGDLFRPLLGKLDGSEAALLNMIKLAGACMFAKQKEIGEEDMQFALQNFGVMELENPTLNPVVPSPAALADVNGYIAKTTQQFRQASGATDTLQAVVQGDSATATEVTLSMNEAVRNLSVSSEIQAETLVKDHIAVILQNAQKYQTVPFTLTINRTPIQIVPADLMIATEVRIKTMTDQDFRPAKVNKLLQVLSLMAQTPPNALTGVKLDITPTLLEILKQLDVPNFDRSVQQISDDDLIKARVISEMMTPATAQAGGVPNTEPPSAGRIADVKPGRREQRVVGAANDAALSGSTITTPTGQVLSAPGDQQMSLAAERASNATVPQQNLPGRQL